jgi:predicted Fe-Mo cluster-binding NifX family protein
MKTKEVINTAMETPPPHEPGVLPAWLAQHNVNIILAGGMGQRAQGMFVHRGITVVVGAPPLKPVDVVMQYINGTLTTGSNLCDH